MRRKGIRIPIIITTGMSAIDERIEGLDGGADDYLVKPFHIRESCQVRALTRRPAKIQTTDILNYADLELDKSSRKVSSPDRTIILTAKESELLYVLMRKPETLYTREQLILKIWGADLNR